MTKQSSDYYYCKVIIPATGAHRLTTISIDQVTYLMLTRKVGGPRALNVLLREESKALREASAERIQGLSAKALAGVKFRVGFSG